MDKVLCQQYLSDLSLVGFERNTKGITISGIDTPPPSQREVFVGVLGVGGEGTSHRAKAQHSGNKEPFFTPQHTEFGQVWWISEKQKDLKGLSSRGSQLLPVSIISRKVLLNICISLTLDSISVIMLFFTEQLVQNTLMSTIGSTK